MPRELRKRGRKHKKPAVEVPAPAEEQAVQAEEPEPQAGPSWIVSSSNAPEINPEAPFGYVDADVKAYFRTVDVQLRDWQDNTEEALDGDEDVDPNENRRMFLLASLQEMTGKERELATDPDCSNVLERMAYSMDDFVRRVFMDSLTGSYERLVKHRFASHVVQTLLDVAADTVSRESRNIMPSVEETSDKGELRTLTQLVIDLCEELIPSFSTLVMDPFGSHVVRSLFVLLCPALFSSDASNKMQSTVRSKKSTAWKAKQGPMKSVFSDDRNRQKAGSAKNSPEQFRHAAKRFVGTVRAELGENEVRSLAANKVASPVLQMLLEVEADQGMANEPNSLMDCVLSGLITLHHNDPTAQPEASDFLSTLFRDPTSSHLLETIVSRTPEAVFHIMWSVYFDNKLSRLAVHPVANFVVAKSIDRVSADQLKSIIEELGGAWGKIRVTRTGVLRALVDRAAALQAAENDVCEALYAAFDIKTDEDQQLFVPSVLRLQTAKEYQDALAAASSRSAATADIKESEPPKTRFRSGKNTADDPLEPKTAGAVLLQSLLRLPDPHNQIVLKSVQFLPIEDVIVLAQHPTSSRVLDAILDSPTVPSKTKRRYILSFIGHYEKLVDDRIGSRVGDRCWASADPYLKEKIARSLIPHEMTLSASYYGKFFARNLNLYLLQRRPDEWRSMQSSASAAKKTTSAKVIDAVASVPPATSEPHTASTTVAPAKKRKRELPGDEIDALFESALGKKVKKSSLAHNLGISDAPKDDAALQVDSQKERKHKKDRKIDKGKKDDLGDVLGAIRSAPKGEEKSKKKRR